MNSIEAHLRQVLEVSLEPRTGKPRGYMFEGRERVYKKPARGCSLVETLNHCLSIVNENFVLSDVVKTVGNAHDQRSKHPNTGRATAVRKRLNFKELATHICT